MLVHHRETVVTAWKFSVAVNPSSSAPTARCRFDLLLDCRRQRGLEKIVRFALVMRKLEPFQQRVLGFVASSRTALD